MTDTIVHLDKEQTRIQRRKLLANDVYVLFCDHLRQLNKEGQTALSQVEVFLSATNFVHLLMSLPDIWKGIDDELDDLEEEAEGENDAMIISVVALFIIRARGRHPTLFDYYYKCIISHVFVRWARHPLYRPMMQAAERKAQVRWMQGRKCGLLTCELEEIERDEEGDEAVKELFRYFVGMAGGGGKSTIKENLLILNKYNSDHGNRYKSYIDALYEMLREETTGEGTKVQTAPRGPRKQSLFTDKKARNEEKQRFMRYLSDHKMSGRKLTCEKNDTLNDVVTCFVIKWQDKGLTAREPSGGAIFRFLTEECDLQSEVTGQSYSNKIKERLREKNYTAETWKKVNPYFL